MRLKDRLEKKKKEPVSVTIRLEAGLNDWVRACANKYGTTITDVIIASIEEAREEMMKNGEWR